MIYLDNSATSQVLPEVLDTYNQVTTEYFANPSSIHALGQRSSKLLEQARRQVADILGFEASEIYFGSSGTEMNNFVFFAVLASLKEIHPNRNRVLISEIEHPSVSQFISVCEELGYDVNLIEVDENACIKLDAFKDLLGDDVLLVSNLAVNNEVGAIQPLYEMAEILEDYPQVAWHVDAVQAATIHIDLLQNKRIDLLTLSSHKFHSVRGLGILAKRSRLESKPYIYGGGQEAGLRSGTENLAAIVAGAKALRIVSSEQEEVSTRLASYRKQLVETFINNGWNVFAKDNASPHILCVALREVPGEVLVNAFGKYEMYVSTTSACSSRRSRAHSTLLAMGVREDIAQSAIRISLSRYTTQEEITKVCSVIPKITEQFKKKGGQNAK